MESAELVAVGITEIGKVEFAEAPLAVTGRILDRRPARFDARLVPGIDLFGAVEREANRAAIGVRRRRAVDWPGNHEDRALAAVNEPTLVIDARLLAEQGIVEPLGPIVVVRSDHHVTVHACLLRARPLGSRSPCCRYWACRWDRSATA